MGRAYSRHVARQKVAPYIFMMPNLQAVQIQKSCSAVINGHQWSQNLTHQWKYEVRSISAQRRLMYIPIGIRGTVHTS
jgi:hypothetical protein